LSGRGLCDELITRPEESYRLCCVVVCDLETSRMGAPYIYDISHLKVNIYIYIYTYIYKHTILQYILPKYLSVSGNVINTVLKFIDNTYIYCPPPLNVSAFLTIFTNAFL